MLPPLDFPPPEKSALTGGENADASRGTDGSNPVPSSWVWLIPGVPGRAPKIAGFRAAVLMVRIPFPPAESQVRTCLSREFAFPGREAAVFRGCPGRDERPGSAETRGRGNIWPKGGDISVAPYSSTAPPVMKSATMPRILSRMRDPP
jgi:hypothetical protein